MNIKIVGAGISLLILGIFAIATSSIAIECYNAHADAYKQDKEHNFNFSIATLVMGILAIISASVSIGVLARAP